MDRGPGASRDQQVQDNRRVPRLRQEIVADIL